MSKQLLMGNEAFAHAALEAGVGVVAGYPGTPSSELVETVAKLRSEGRAHGVHVEWSTNEKAALELLAGASYCGARTLFTCKQVGLNVASDALMSLNYVGIKGGFVLFVADDPGPISSQTEQDTRRFGSFSKVPVLDPSTPEEGFAMMKAAFDLSERYATPVIVRPTTRINHASTFFDVEDETFSRLVPEEGFEKSPRWVIFPKRAWEAHGEINERLRSIANDYACDEELSSFNRILETGVSETGASEIDGPADGVMVPGITEIGEPAAVALETDAPAMDAPTAGEPKFGIAAGGVSAAYALEALRSLEKRAELVGTQMPSYRFWSVGTPYPFPAKMAGEFAAGLSDILVLEELDHVIEDALLVYAGKAHAQYDVHGRLTGEARDRGENDVDDIERRLAEFLGVACLLDGGIIRSDGITGSRDTVSYDAPLPVRPPVLCAGCPHRGSFYAMKRALKGTPAVLCGDIGCYTLGNAKPLDAVDTCLCMGAGITMAQGFSVVEPGKKQVAFVGDSTFFASGMTGIANAVYNGHDVTVCVLDNSTTAMTGSQPHPGTGVTLMRERRKPISIEHVLEGLGVECIVHTNPLDLDDSISAAKQALGFEGPSVILFESPCVQLKKPEPAMRVDTERCTGCKRCITEIGCPGLGFSLEIEGSKSGDRGQAYADANLCNGCGLCSQICPSGAIVAQAASCAKSGSEAQGCEASDGASSTANDLHDAKETGRD